MLSKFCHCVMQMVSCALCSIEGHLARVRGCALVGWAVNTVVRCRAEAQSSVSAESGESKQNSRNRGPGEKQRKT